MIVAAVLAGGVGSRLGLGKPKQFLEMAGKTILEHTVQVFEDHPGIDEIVIVMHGQYLEEARALVVKNGWKKVKALLNGGKERYESSVAALKAYENHPDRKNIKILFHDAVRPLVSAAIIDRTLEALKEHEAVNVAIPSTDTVLELDESRQFIKAIPDRSYLRRCQTPQAFSYELIHRGYELAMADQQLVATDDCGIIIRYLPQIPVFVVEGEGTNMKLTYPEDITILERLFQLKAVKK